VPKGESPFPDPALGFEKFKRSNREQKSKPESEEEGGSKLKKEKEEKAKNKEEEEHHEEGMYYKVLTYRLEKTEEEDHHESKRGEEHQKKEQEGWKQFLFDPNNNPKYENWAIIAALAGFTTFYFMQPKPSQEVTYMEFINQYLTKNQVKMITITQDRGNEMFKYRAEIETHDGAVVHLVLPQVENFLYKLDLVQREMGKVPNDFVPVKYASESSGDNNVMLQFLIAGMLGLTLLQVYRTFKGRQPPKGGASKGGSHKAGQTGKD